MALTNKIKASSMMEAIVSIALISAVMVIVFPFFGQILESNHQLEIMNGLRIINELETNAEYEPFSEEIQEFTESGITIRITTQQDKENPMLYLLTTELVNHKNKIVYSLTEYKYRP